MIQTLPPEALPVIPAYDSTVPKWALNRFHASRAVVRTYLKDAPSKIYISCDMCTSLNGHAILSVVGHWCTMEKTLQSILLGLLKVMGSHSGVNVAVSLVDVLEKYQITDKVGYMMLDNASNNDTLVEGFMDEIANRGLPMGQHISSDEWCLGCAGHVVNLVVHEMLFGKDEATLETDPDNFTTW